MKKKIVFLSIIISIIVILIASIYLYSTYATDPIESNDSYTITLSGDTSVSVPANSSKKVIYQIKNTNDGTVNYAVGYSSENQDSIVKVYYDSTDPASGTIAANNFKYIKLRVINNSNTNASINLSTILGYENGGELIVPSGVTKVTEIIYNAVEYITNLYNTDTNKSHPTVNGITYSLASSVGLMRDQFGSSSSASNTGNLRYYGANPNNYVWLGDSYTSDHTIPGTISEWNYSDFNDCIDCEGYDEEKGALYCTEDTVRRTGDKKLWRIVGVFDGKLKLVSNDPISSQDLSWDTSANTTGGNSGWGINQWGPSGTYEGADLMRLLNPGFESESVNNSLYWTKGTGTVYTGWENATTPNVSFANTGLTANERSLIDIATWYTGAYDQFSYADAHYTAERGTMSGKATCTQGTKYCDDTVTRTNTWNGKVGLISASDYGYAANLAQCNQTLDNYYETGCTDTDWLKSNSIYWTMSPCANSVVGDVFFVLGGFRLDETVIGGNGASPKVRPAVFLKSDVVIIDGNGSENTPYILNLG